METQEVLIVLSGLVIFSYLFDLIAKKTRIPSVLLLLGLGIGIRALFDYFYVPIYDFSKILPTVGTMGLILIILEGALELHYEKSKKELIVSALSSAFFILLFSSLSIAFVLNVLTGSPFITCLVNAIPFSVISSAIAIPSVAFLSKSKKEFIIYESSLSDILGIIFFNFAMNYKSGFAHSLGMIGLDMFFIILLSAAFCLFLLYLIGRINHGIKFFLIISILILVFAIGKNFHLSSLVIILAFGLFLNNADTIKNEKFRKIFMYDNYKKDLNQLFQLTAESAFILRTFFFVIFGFTIDLDILLTYHSIFYGGIILISTYLIRAIYLKFIAKMDLIPELYLNPRGLITILLFLSIPQELRLMQPASGVLFLVVLSSCLLMTVGLFRTKSL